MATPKQFRDRGRWTLIIGTLLAALTFGAVMAFASSSSANRIDWTGQGTSGGVLNTPKCGDDADFGGITPPAGVTADNYLLWILSPVDTDTLDSVTLHTNGDTVTWPGAGTKDSGSQIKFLTTGYDLATLDAYVEYVGTIEGSPDLKISHGCLGGKAQPEISTTASTSGEGETGDTFNDTATLSGGTDSPAISGKITFRLYNLDDDSNCTGPPLYSEDVTVDSGNGDYTTATGYKIETKGTYTWTAEYFGDENNEPAGPEGCGDESETLDFQADAPDIQTTIHLGKAADEGTPTEVGGATHVPLGSYVHDSATATGGPSVPEGTIEFTFYSTIDCSGQGVAAGSVGLVNGVAHPSSDQGALAAGSYGFNTHYTSSNEAKWANSDGTCEPLTVDKAQLTITTQIHDASHGDVGDSTHVPLGSVVHDTATVTGAVPGFDPEGAISFTLNGNPVDNDPTADGTATARSVDSDPLAAGSYTYAASVADDDNYIGDTSDDEPLTVDKAQLSIVTHIHNASHADITNTTVQVGTVVHDTASVTGGVSGFAIPAVSFTLNGNAVANADPAEAGFAASTVDSAPLAGGSYIYKATVDGDSNYLGATSADEPLSVRTFGYTMGYWGNTNGQARLAANNAFSAGNAVSLGEPNVSSSDKRCNVTVDSAAKSKTIFPNTSNGASLITQCDATAERDTGINLNSFNVLLAQTLALSYNNLYKTGFAGQNIGGMGCTAVGTLTPGSTTQNAQAYANYLIGELIKSGSGNTSAVITQTQIGAMNTLLGCMNTES